MFFSYFLYTKRGTLWSDLHKSWVLASAAKFHGSHAGACTALCGIKHSEKK